MYHGFLVYKVNILMIIIDINILPSWMNVNLLITWFLIVSISNFQSRHILTTICLILKIKQYSIPYFIQCNLISLIITFFLTLIDRSALNTRLNSTTQCC